MEYIPTENALAARRRETEDSSKLVEHISSQRNYQLNHFFKKCQDQMLEIEKKYGKYLMVPLAVPLFELPNPDHFKKWYFDHAIRPIKQKGDYVASVTGISPFYSVDLVQKIGDDWNLNLQKDSFVKEFPHLWQQFYEVLPCDDILTINLWSSVETFSEHRDSAEMWDGPNSFRIPLYDENPESTLYVMDNPTKPYKVEDTHWLPRLPDTNTYMWNNLRCMHGSVKDDNYQKILAVIVGVVNPDKYNEVMSKSIDVYKDYVLESKYKLEDYVDV